MNKKRVQIVLDADVIIHFAKGSLLSQLPSFLPEYEFVVLDVVKKEVLKPTITQLENQIAYIKNIKEVTFGSTSEEKKEYARLTKNFGKGESACMVYCRFNKEVVGSNNTKDIEKYCNENGITFLTTNDFLYYGIKRKKITIEGAENFIKEVISKNSNPPIVDFRTYFCNKL